MPSPPPHGPGTTTFSGDPAAVLARAQALLNADRIDDAQSLLAQRLDGLDYSGCVDDPTAFDAIHLYASLLAGDHHRRLAEFL
jgi:hypothetical protein